MGLYVDAVIQVLINNESFDLTELVLKSSVSLSFLTRTGFIGLYTLKD